MTDPLDNFLEGSSLEKRPKRFFILFLGSVVTPPWFFFWPWFFSKGLA